MNNNKKFKLMLLTAITPLGITLSGWVHGKSLLEVYQIAATNDPVLHQAYANFKSVEQNIPISVANLLPEVILNAGMSYDKVLDFGENQSVHSKYFSLDFTQPIFYWDRISRYLQSELEVQKAIHDLEIAKEDLLIRVSEAYFNILESQDHLEYVRTEKDAVKRLYDESVERFNVGLIPTADVDEAKAKHDLITSDEIAAINAVADRYEQLREILGEDVKDINVLTPKYVPSNPKPTDIEQWVKLASERNHTIRSEKLASEIMKKNEDIAFAGHLPSADFTAGYRGVDASRSIILDEISNAKGYLSSMGASVEGRVEIFGGGGTQAGVNKAEYNTIAAQYNTERARREAVSLTRQSYRNVLTNVNQISALEQAVVSGLSALDATEASYEVGTRASIDVLDRLTDLYDQKSKLSASRYSYIKNVLLLKRNAGVLTDKDVKTVDSWLVDKSSKALKEDKSQVRSSILQKIKEFDNVEFNKNGSNKDASTTDKQNIESKKVKENSEVIDEKSTKKAIASDPNKKIDTKNTKTKKTPETDSQSKELVSPENSLIPNDAEQEILHKKESVTDDTNGTAPKQSEINKPEEEAGLVAPVAPALPEELNKSDDATESEQPIPATPKKSKTAEKLNQLIKKPDSTPNISDPIKQLEEQLRQLEAEPATTQPKLPTQDDTAPAVPSSKAKTNRAPVGSESELIPVEPGSSNTKSESDESTSPTTPAEPIINAPANKPKLKQEEDKTLDKLEQDLNRLIEKGS